MTGFTVGDKLVATPGLSEEQIAQIEKEQKQEQQLLTEVTEETFSPIERTSEQESAITEVKNAIDLKDGTLIVSYGVGDANALMDLSNKALSQVRAKDGGETGEMLAKLAVDLSTDGPTDTKGIFGMIKSLGNKAKALQIRYESVQANIERVKGVLEQQQLTLIKNNKDMADMKATNFENYQRLSVYVEAGLQKLKEAEEIELPQLEEKAKNGDQNDVNALNEYKSAINLFEKQVHDLNAQMSLSQNLAIQLTTLTNANLALIQKIQRSKMILIPAWTQTMLVMIYGENSKEAFEADKKFNDATNEAYKKASEALAKTVKETSEHAESASIRIDTLEDATKNIIQSLKDIDDARAKGHEYRQKANARINELRNEIKLQLATTISRQNEVQ
jgi:toxic anion resistance family protein